MLSFKSSTTARRKKGSKKKLFISFLKGNFNRTSCPWQYVIHSSFLAFSFSSFLLGKPSPLSLCVTSFLSLPPLSDTRALHSPIPSLLHTKTPSVHPPLHSLPFSSPLFPLGCRPTVSAAHSLLCPLASSQYVKIGKHTLGYFI